MVRSLQKQDKQALLAQWLLRGEHTALGSSPQCNSLKVKLFMYPNQDSLQFQYKFHLFCTEAKSAME